MYRVATCSSYDSKMFARSFDFILVSPRQEILKKSTHGLKSYILESNFSVSAMAQ